MKKITCPVSGAEFATPEQEFAAIVAVIGQEPGCCRCRSEHKAPKKSPELPKKALDRIEALRSAGADVSNLFAILGANGGECIASNKGGNLTILSDDDPIFSYITKQGTVPNPRLFRRWVMAQMFHMLSHIPYGQVKPLGVTEMIHRLGYEYQWKMLIRELHAQVKMEGRDNGGFADRNRWFNAAVVAAIADDYIAKLKAYVDALPEKKCKGRPYKRIHGRDIYLSNLDVELYHPLATAAWQIVPANNAARLYAAVKKFNDLRIEMTWDTPQSKAWVDAYKGTGAFFTMQNLIRFHGCLLTNDAGRCLDKNQSLRFLDTKAEMYKNGKGWQLLGVLKKMLDDNGIDVRKTVEQWRSRKQK